LLTVPLLFERKKKREGVFDGLTTLVGVKKHKITIIDYRAGVNNCARKQPAWFWVGDVEPPVFSDATDRRPCTPPLLPAFKESKDEWRFYAFKNWLFS